MGVCFFLYRRWQRRRLRHPKTPTTSRSLQGAGGGRTWSARSNSANTISAPQNVGLADDNNAADRQERLGLVRASLLRQKELNGGLIGNTQTANPAISLPRKAFLKKVDGRLVLDRGLKLDARSDGRFNEKERVGIEASGRWEDSATVSRVSLGSGVGRGVGMEMEKRNMVSRDEEVERRAERESKISLAKWRDPVSWVKDQVERRNGGMQRLPD